MEKEKFTRKIKKELTGMVGKKQSLSDEKTKSESASEHKSALGVAKHNNLVSHTLSL